MRRRTVEQLRIIGKTNTHLGSHCDSFLKKLLVVVVGSGMKHEADSSRFVDGR